MIISNYGQIRFINDENIKFYIIIIENNQITIIIAKNLDLMKNYRLRIFY